MTPSFTDLNYFHEVAESLNFSHAAKKLGISQPSLSMAINRLETLLNIPLFIRHRLGVTLTQSGERLYAEVSELIEKWKSIEANIQTLAQEVSGKVVVGCHSATLRPVTAVVSTLLENYPALEIQIHDEISTKITQNVIEGIFDIGVVIDPHQHSELVLCKLQDLEMSFWISTEMKYDASVIICNPQLNQVQHLLRAFKTIENKKRICAANSFEVVAHLTAIGAGIGILPNCYVELEYKHELTPLAHAPSYATELYLIYRGENRKMLAIKKVLSSIKELLGTAANETN